MADAGKLFMLLGGSLFIVGLLLSISGRFSWMGNLPGDIHVERGGFSVFAPIGTMIVLSLLLTIALNVIVRFFR